MTHEINEDLFQWLGLIFMWVCAILWGRVMAIRMNAIEAKWQNFLNRRKELYDSLADPKKIEEDLEKSARRREMYDANRSTLPRENSGPPAKVYRPPLRAQKPASWRPRNPGSPSRE